MSQQKVDQYKQYKQNKEKILKKEKRQARIEIGIFIAIMVAFVGWFGWSVYDKVTAPDPDAEVTVTEIDMNAYNDYVSTLQTGYTS